MKKIYTNRYTATLLQLFIVFFILFLLRIFYSIYNSDVFESLPLTVIQGGFLFDFLSVLYLNILFIVLRIMPFDFVEKPKSELVAKIIFITTNSLGIVLSLIDTVYYPFTGTRMRATFIDEMTSGDNGFNIILKFIPSYWYLVLIAAFLIALMIFLYNRIVITQSLNTSKVRKRFVRVFAIILTAFIIVVTMRGGIQAGKPLGINDAIAYAPRPVDINLVLNTPYTIMRSIGFKGEFKLCSYELEKETQAYLPPLIKNNLKGEFQKKNVVLIIMEGIGSGATDFFTPDSLCTTYRGITPFLDSLASESYVCYNTYSCGKRSVDGITAIIGGFPAYVPFVYMKSRYNGNQVDALSSLLSDKGYETTFFCGCSKGSYTFESFAKAMGYKNFYGRGEYGNEEDFDGTWGIFDDKKGKYIIDKVKNYSEPYLATWFLLTSHGPYVLPKEYQGRYKSPSGTFEETVEYDDEVLREFFNEMKKMKGYENTLFVITADHSSDFIYDFLNTQSEKSRIPLIFFTPDGSLKPHIDYRATSQIDIGSSILGYLNYDEPYISYGADVFSSDIRFAINCQDGIHRVVEDDYSLFFNGTTSTELYHNSDRDYKKNLIAELPDTVKKMESRVKAFIEEYTHRMIQNKMSIKRINPQKK